MKIGLVGYQGSGKSSLFQWLSGQPPDASKSHAGQSAMVPILDPRVDALAKIYEPKKLTHAALELVDTPGLDREHQGNAARLAVIREAGCLVLVVGAYAGSDADDERRRFAEDLLLADMELVAGRIDRLRESLKKPRPSRAQDEAQLAALVPILSSLEECFPLRDLQLDHVQQRAIKSFSLLTDKPKLVVINTADEVPPSRQAERLEDGVWSYSVPLALELELERMSGEDRAEFEREMDLPDNRRQALLMAMMDVSGQHLFFTTGPREVRSWILRQGGTALDAAEGIHTDLARGFIRAETMTCADLIRLGSEREIKAAGLLRQEPKDYVVQDDDILLIRFSV